MEIIKCKYCGKLPRMSTPPWFSNGGFKYGYEICANCYFKKKEQRKRINEETK